MRSIQPYLMFAAKKKHCGKKKSESHTEWDCWYNPRNMAPEAVAKRKAKSKAKGTPKSKGKGSKKGFMSALFKK